MRKTIALRIDVDTYRGTGRGVPRLGEIFADNAITGTFYFSVGPDNMGRHLWRLLKPAFLWKMLRTNAAGLYGPEIVLMGTAWPGLRIGRHHEKAIQDIIAMGNESGFHAWDHHYAQAHLTDMSRERMRRELNDGLNELKRILGSFPVSSAAPGWRANDQLLEVKKEFGFAYNTDCRGFFPFYPVVNGEKLTQMQIPVTLPTYDEALGCDGVTDENYNDYQLSLLKDDELNVLTIHAEAEGGRCSAMFDAYVKEAHKRGFRFVTLGEVASELKDKAPAGCMKLKEFPGREGELAVQVVER